MLRGKVATLGRKIYTHTRSEGPKSNSEMMQFQVLLGGGLGVWIGVWGGWLASLGDLGELDWGPGGAGLRSWGSRLGDERGFLNVYFR